MLSGYKTYLVATASLAYVGIGLGFGFMDWSHAEPLIQTALVAFGLRAAVSKAGG